MQDEALLSRSQSQGNQFQDYLRAQKQNEQNQLYGRGQQQNSQLQAWDKGQQQLDQLQALGVGQTQGNQKQVFEPQTQLQNWIQAQQQASRSPQQQFDQALRSSHQADQIQALRAAEQSQTLRSQNDQLQLLRALQAQRQADEAKRHAEQVQRSQQRQDSTQQNDQVQILRAIQASRSAELAQRQAEILRNAKRNQIQLAPQLLADEDLLPSSQGQVQGSLGQSQGSQVQRYPGLEATASAYPAPDLSPAQLQSLRSEVEQQADQRRSLESRFQQQQGLDMFDPFLYGAYDQIQMPAESAPIPYRAAVPYLSDSMLHSKGYMADTNAQFDESELLNDELSQDDQESRRAVDATDEA